MRIKTSQYLEDLQTAFKNGYEKGAGDERKTFYADRELDRLNRRISELECLIHSLREDVEAAETATQAIVDAVAENIAMRLRALSSIEIERGEA